MYLRKSSQFRSLLKEADKHLAEKLRDQNQAVITPYGFFRLIQEMYRGGTVRSLRKHTVPNERVYYKYFRRLRRLDIIDPDPDYGAKLMRVRVVSSQPVEELVCLADPLCHLSHLSAMQRWGLTNRSPTGIIFTRPDKPTARARLAEIMENEPGSLPPKRFWLRSVKHPSSVRDRDIRITESRAPGACIEMPDRPLRLATIGQTFLDMLQKPELCGGMSHVLDVFDEHAGHWCDEIIAARKSSNAVLGIYSRNALAFITKPLPHGRHQHHNGEGVASWTHLGVILYTVHRNSLKTGCCP